MLEKWPFLDQNHGLTPLEKCQFLDFLKMSIFRLFKPSFLQPRKVFLVLEYRKTHFPGLYCLKKKVGIMAIYRTKPWVNPFEKMSIFQLFKLCVFIAQKRVYWFQNFEKHIFLAYIALKKSRKNGHFWTKTMG